MSELLVEVHPFEVAAPEVRSLRVWDLHLLSLPFVFDFEDASERRSSWSNSRTYVEQNAGSCLGPRGYTANALSKDETVGELEQRLKIRLVAVKTVVEKGG